MRKFARALRVGFGLYWEADRWRTVALIMLIPPTSVVFIVSTVMMKILIDSFVNHDSGGEVIAVVGLALSWGVGFGLSLVQFTVQVTITDRASHVLDRRMMAVTAGITGIEHHERPDYLDRMQLLRNERDLVIYAPFSFLWVFALALQVLLVAGILAHLHPLLLLLPLAGVPSLVASGYTQGLEQRYRDATASEPRRSQHVMDLSADAGSGKELRIFSLGPWMEELHKQAWARLTKKISRAIWVGTALTALGWLFFAASYGLALLLVVDRVTHGHGTPGDVVLAVGGVAQVNGLVAAATGIVAFAVVSFKQMGRYLWLVDYARDSEECIDHPAAIPERIERGIELRNVSFAYPGTENQILDGISLTLPAGKVVALVGENGAGKTTLVKLLCRFYEPSAGHILIDGTDISSFTAAAWRERISAGFQDFARFEFLARETVGVGELRHLDELPKVEEALARAGAQDMADRMPNGLATQLGKQWPEGVDLSGGQWQKLALGRALMRQTPLLTVFDEPTAALDAQTEHALFERFASAAGAASTRGAVTVLVSHRFSTVRMADLIVVLEGGRIREQGSHEELVRQSGLYAELYEIQARAYR